MGVDQKECEESVTNETSRQTFAEFIEHYGLKDYANETIRSLFRLYCENFEEESHPFTANMLNLAKQFFPVHEKCNDMEGIMETTIHLRYNIEAGQWLDTVTPIIVGGYEGIISNMAETFLMYSDENEDESMTRLQSLVDGLKRLFPEEIENGTLWDIERLRDTMDYTTLGHDADEFGGQLVTMLPSIIAQYESDKGLIPGLSNTLYRERLWVIVDAFLDNTLPPVFETSEPRVEDSVEDAAHEGSASAAWNDGTATHRVHGREDATDENPRPTTRQRTDTNTSS